MCWVGLLPNATTCAHEASEARCQLEVQLLLGLCASEQQGLMSARKPEDIDRRWLEVAGDGLAQAIEVCRKPRRVDMMVVAPTECDDALVVRTFQVPIVGVACDDGEDVGLFCLGVSRLPDARHNCVFLSH